MEHLALEIFDLDGKASKYASLPNDTSITITDTSEIFASGDVWSYDFKLNIRANAHIFGTSGELHGSRLHDQINKRRARLWVEGLPIYLGYLMLGDEADVDSEGNVDVTFESGHKTFEEMTEGAKANQVPMIGDVKFGVALWTKRKLRLRTRVAVSADVIAETDLDPTRIYNLNLEAWGSTEDTVIHIEDGEKEGHAVQEYPRMVFPKGTFLNMETGRDDEVNYLNTDSPYDEGHPYCNIALCYQRYGYTKKDALGREYQDYTQEPEAERGYEEMPANRVNSAPNFFVIYWVKALMKHLGIYIEENQMMDVEDLRRLFFLNTNCAYRMPSKVRGDDYDKGYTRYKFSTNKRYIAERDLTGQNSEDAKGVSFESIQVGEPTIEYIGWGRNIENIRIEGDPQISLIDSFQDDAFYEEENGYLHDAFATSECFPNADISDVIKALENGFGIRLLFSGDYQRVRIILLRNIFQSNDLQDIKCDIEADVKTENNIRGFRMTYGDSEDTTFYYKGFADKLPHKKPYFIDDSDKHDYSHWQLDAEYSNIINKISAFDKTCFVTPDTGNAYGIKIDNDAKRYKDLHPSLFEYAGYMDAEDGDCSGDAETIEEINVGFTPAILNDLNMEAERKATNAADRHQRFALLVNEQMRPRRPNMDDLEAPRTYNDSDAVYDVNKMYEKFGPGSTNNMSSGDGIIQPGLFTIASDTCFQKQGSQMSIEVQLSVSYWNEIDVLVTDIAKVTYPITCDYSGFILEGYRLWLQDNYEPNDDGISPIEKHDNGLTLGIMRGSGSDAYINYSPDWKDKDEDYENDTWELVPGSNVSTHPDTCDAYGNEWDYNGNITPEQAETEIVSNYPDTRNSILADRYGVVYKSDLYAKGWTHAGSQHEEASYFYYRYKLNTLEGVKNVYCTPIKGYERGSRPSPYVNDYVMSTADMEAYIQSLWDRYGNDMTAHDSLYLIYAVDPDNWSRIEFLHKSFFQYTTDPALDNGIGINSGRISLKLRAEKPNPYYEASVPSIVTTKEQAAKAMTKLYTKADPDLLTRPRVTNAQLRAAGWDIEGDGDGTAFSVIYSVRLDGKQHEILWTPIRTNSVIMTPRQLENYIATFNGLSIDSLKTVDVLKMILDVDTTEERKNILYGLESIYYAEDGQETVPVDVSSINKRYLEIDNENLRGRGLCDTMYKEYSFWIRNARISKKTVRMELSQLLAIDKTKKVRVGDTIGFIRKLQYSVSKDAGLGMVTMELMYI